MTIVVIMAKRVAKPKKPLSREITVISIITMAMIVIVTAMFSGIIRIEPTSSSPAIVGDISDITKANAIAKVLTAFFMT